ncbi:MAG: MoaD/ThiS family protein [Anaerolineae bacterium]|jgi:molybdopterin synthase sulfur carrier subunit
MKVRVFATLRALAGGKDIDVEVGGRETVRDVMKKLTATYPALGERILDDDGKVQNSMHVLVNGRSIRFLDGLDTVIREGDRLALFPAIGGG